MGKRYNKYNSTNTCDGCKIEELKPHNARREYNKEGNWTGRWLCYKCWLKLDYHKRPDTDHNIIKSLRDRRTGNLRQNSSQAKGDMFEELTCRWRGIKNLNIENDNFNSPIDHSRDPELGIVQTRGKFYDSYNQIWSFSNLKKEHKKNFDVLICYCASKDGKIIERIYIFPKEEIVKRSGITIYKNPSKGSWYEKYRVKDENTLKRVNELFKKIRNVMI